MKGQLYTNTSSVKGVIGLVFVTIVVSAAQAYGPAIVKESYNLAKQGAEKLNELAHNGKKQYSVIERRYDGKLVDTGKRIWR